MDGMHFIDEPTASDLLLAIYYGEHSQPSTNGPREAAAGDRSTTSPAEEVSAAVPAKQAHSPETAVCDFIHPGDVDRLLIARYIRKRHPDARVAAGKCPRPLPLRGLPRADRALLLRLRIGCHHAAERMHRLTGRGSPFCADCGDTETLDHLLLHCSASSGARIKLLAAYAKHGLPRARAEHLLFPHCRQGGRHLANESYGREPHRLQLKSIFKKNFFLATCCNARNLFLTSPQSSLYRTSTLSTSSENIATALGQITEITVHAATYDITSYGIAPDNSCKGVVHGIGHEITPDDFLKEVEVPGYEVLTCRRLGDSGAMVLTFCGKRVPFFVNAYGQALRCYLYKRTIPHCRKCNKTGHREDVCPQPP
ncbi:hypothetical protein MTO96_038733 [Rhipicephalus appendiculatus]